MSNKRDIRLYMYASGGLRKIGHGQMGVHKYTSVPACMINLEKMRKKSPHTQFVITEYFDSHISRIIYITSMDIASVV